MKRRNFLKYGCAGTAAALAPSAGWAQSGSAAAAIDLHIEPCDYEMIDGQYVYMVFFFLGDAPHPVLRVREGEPVTVRVTNGDTRPHAFAITGIPQASIGPVAPGQAATVTFPAPVGGSYLYHDPTNAPLNRLLGLYGAFIVKPRLGTTPSGSPTPFSREAQTAQVRALFDALGRATRFPGDQWDPEDDIVPPEIPHRDKVWVIAEVDPVLNARVDAGENVPGASVLRAFLPRYFHINAISGFDTADHEELTPEKRAAGRAIEPEGCEGQPAIVRMMNAGLCTHAPHIHGNPFFDLTRQVGDAVSCTDNVLEVDTLAISPMERKDLLLPFHKPPDVPVWPPKQEPFPLRYVMHCHTEMSQTAGGGNYPMGLVTHWEMTAPLERCAEH